MGEKLKGLGLSAVLLIIGVIFAVAKGDSWFIWGFIPVPGWLVAGVFVVLGLILLVANFQSKD